MSFLSRAVGLEGLHVSRRLTTAGVVGVAAALMGAVAVVFLAVALHAALAPSVGPAWAAVIVAGIALLVAVILGLVASALVRRARQDVNLAFRRSAVASAAPAALGLVGRKAGLIGAAAAFAAGFLATRLRP